MASPTLLYTPPQMPPVLWTPTKSFEDVRNKLSALIQYLQQIKTYDLSYFQAGFAGLVLSKNQDTYTPVLQGSTTPGSVTYTLQYGAVFALAQLVIASFVLQWSAFSGAAGWATVTLPVPAVNFVGQRWGGIVYNHAGITYDAGYSYLTLQIEPGLNAAGVVENGSGKTASYLGVGNLAAGFGQLFGQIAYRAA